MSGEGGRHARRKSVVGAVLVVVFAIVFLVKYLSHVKGGGKAVRLSLAAQGLPEACFPRVPEGPRAPRRSARAAAHATAHKGLHARSTKSDDDVPLFVPRDHSSRLERAST